MFSELKIAQMSAFLLSLTASKSLPYIKLIKLLYLSERAAVSRWGTSMSGDNFVSMPHGPVLSQTYDLIQSGGNDGWSSYIKGQSNYCVGLEKMTLERDDLDELSDAELKILRNVNEKFGGMDQWALVKFTHDNCPEWIDPKGSSNPITIDNLIDSLSVEEGQKKALHVLHEEVRSLEQARSILH
jgi:uncharacterized phage-associated protein